MVTSSYYNHIVQVSDIQLSKYIYRENNNIDYKRLLTPPPPTPFNAMFGVRNQHGVYRSNK